MALRTLSRLCKRKRVHCLRCTVHKRSLGSASDTIQDDKLSKFSYWKNRYKRKDNTVFEWFLSSEEATVPILDIIDQIPDSSNYPLWCLDLGCGLSDLTLDLLTQSSRPLCAVMVDFVSEALLYQERRWSERQARGQTSPGLAQLLFCADVKNLPLRDEAVDVVLDKGTMDALIKDKVQGQVNSRLMMQEVLRVLTPGGRYIQISDEDPDSRQLFLEKLGHRDQTSGIRLKKAIPTVDPLVTKYKTSPWKFEIISAPSNNEYFLYWTEKL